MRDFVEAVQTPEMLRLLLILTVADIRAVGPGVWNGWKGQLLRELYYEAESAMSGGDAHAGAPGPRRPRQRHELEERLADLPEETRKHALSRHYDNYWLAFDADAHERHARLMAAADAKRQLLTLAAESNDFRSVTEIVLYTPDHPGLFSKLAGAISVSGGSIVDAKAFTTSDGFALDVFSVQDAEGEAVRRLRLRIERLRQTSRRPCAGQICPRGALGQGGPQKPANSAFYVTPARAISTMMPPPSPP